MYRMFSVDNLSWNIATLHFFNSSVLILLNLEKDLSPEQLVTIKLRKGFGWLHKLRTTNLRHQTQALFKLITIYFDLLTTGTVGLQTSASIQ